MTLGEIIMWFQVAFDSVGALVCLYIAVVITKSFGLGSPVEIRQLVHRIILVSVAVSFAWHAEDIAIDPGRHGLTLTNVALHTSLLAALMICAWRLNRFIKLRRNYADGGMFTGPLSRREMS